MKRFWIRSLILSCLAFAGCPSQPDRGQISYQEQVVFDGVTSLQSKQYNLFLTLLKKDSEAEKQFSDRKKFEDLIALLSTYKITSWHLEKVSENKQSVEKKQIDADTLAVTEHWVSDVDIYLYTEGSKQPIRFARVHLEGQLAYTNSTPQAAAAKKKQFDEELERENAERAKVGKKPMGYVYYDGSERAPLFSSVTNWKIINFIHD